jgi:hypothetical protein
MRTSWTVFFIVALLPVLACSRLNPIDRTPSVSGLGGAGGTTGGGGDAGTGSGAGGAGDGLPCEVQAVLVKYCASCHGTTPSGGAPRSLASYADLTRPDLTNNKISEAEAAVQRMQNKGSPMPPSSSPAPSAAEIAVIQTWVTSGYPKGSCGSGAIGGYGGNGAGGVTSSGTGGSGAAGPGGAGGGVGGTGGAGSSGGSGVAPADGLPCEIQAFLVTRCESCHGTTPSGGAPRALVSYANLTSPDPSNPSLTEAQVALQRMQSAASPMPPSPASPATSAEIATLQNWINAGYPSGSCSGDAGVPVNDPLNAAPTCTSKTTWTRGTNGSASMEPGQACISCHARSGGEAPTFVIAGTLYPTGHEPDNCNGASGSTTGAKIVVTGSNGNTVSLTPNGAGNFYSSTSLPGPYKAKVVNGTGVERVMSGTASTGDCNSCHTQNGASAAPGRITLP